MDVLLDLAVGVAHDVGSPMTFWILPAMCKVIARSTVSSLMEDKLKDPVIQAWIAELDLSIKENIRDTLSDDEINYDLVGVFPEVPDDIFLPDHNAEHDPAEPDATISR
jgi:hypothetical protein